MVGNLSMPRDEEDAIRKCLENCIASVVEECAKVCEGRAAVRRENIVVHNEAMKCADQIRHNMTALDVPDMETVQQSIADMKAGRVEPLQNVIDKLERGE